MKFIKFVAKAIYIIVLLALLVIVKFVDFDVLFDYLLGM